MIRKTGVFWYNRSVEIITNNAKETFELGQKIGKDLISNSQKGRIVCLYGDLGSGKTVFSQGLAKSFGISDLVPSPTFIIVRHYSIPVKVGFTFFHIDLYRLENMQEIANLGLSEIFSNPNNFIAVEWAEKLDKLLSKQRIDVKFTILDGSRRKIDISYERS